MQPRRTIVEPISIALLVATILVAIAVVVAVVTARSAYARPHPFDIWTPAAARPAAFVGGRLNCAKSVNAALAARGLRGTGSGLASSFDRWGYRSGPRAGAVAVMRGRGPSGRHVAIVKQVLADGRVQVWNPRPNGWRLRTIPARAATFRVAGW